LKRFILSRNS